MGQNTLICCVCKDKDEICTKLSMNKRCDNIDDALHQMDFELVVFGCISGGKIMRHIFKINSH